MSDTGGNDIWDEIEGVDTSRRISRVLSNEMARIVCVGDTGAANEVRE